MTAYSFVNLALNQSYGFLHCLQIMCYDPKVNNFSIVRNEKTVYDTVSALESNALTLLIALIIQLISNHVKTSLSAIMCKIFPRLIQ